MTRSNLLAPTPVKILALGLLTFTLLALRFSPNWVEVYRELRDVRAGVSSPAHRAAIDKAILDGYSARGYFVTRQALNLAAKIDDPSHKIVRWRLLAPALGHFLGLPGWLTLGLAHAGCLVLVLALVAIGTAQSTAAGRPAYEAMCLGIVGGASAPFFTSMGLPGYYDSWLALALIGVAFARRRWVVVIACLLAPWVDERFVIGLPLALCVRWIRSERITDSPWEWCKGQALIPMALAAGYAVVRLQLGGSGGSQTVGEYLKQFVFAHRLSAVHYATGAWAGLRVGWLLVAAAVLGSWAAVASRFRLPALLLGAGAGITGVAGLFTALDLSRSMVLLIPVVPLGWMFAARSPWWSRLHAAPILAMFALLLPARHVVGQLSRPVDSLWSPPLPLADAANGLGLMYANGNGVSKNATEAVKWYRKAAEQGYAPAQSNLGVMYTKGEGVPKDSAEAVKWYRRAAEQGLAPAQSNLGVLYATGEGVPKDSTEAVKWYRRAAEQGNTPAQANLAAMCAKGDGTPQNSVEAAWWYRQAAEQGHAPAQCDLGVMYAAGNGVPKDSTEAVNWYRKSAEQGHAPAQSNLGVMYAKGDGVAQDKAEATKWYRRAAGQGYAPAQSNLGVMYANGDGVPQDSAEAVKWYRRAAEQGYAPAQSNLGVMYVVGEGLPKDAVQAAAWWILAEASGDNAAKQNLAIIEKELSPEQKAEAMKRARVLVERRP